MGVRLVQLALTRLAGAMGMGLVVPHTHHTGASMVLPEQVRHGRLVHNTSILRNTVVRVVSSQAALMLPAGTMGMGSVAQHMQHTGAIMVPHDQARDGLSVQPSGSLKRIVVRAEGRRRLKVAPPQPPQLQAQARQQEHLPAQTLRTGPMGSGILGVTVRCMRYFIARMVLRSRVMQEGLVHSTTTLSSTAVYVASRERQQPRPSPLGGGGRLVDSQSIGAVVSVNLQSTVAAVSLLGMTT